MQHFAGLTEEALEAMAEQYREPPPPQAAPDLAGDEWPDLGAAATNGKHSIEAGMRLLLSSNGMHDVGLPSPSTRQQHINALSGWHHCMGDLGLHVCSTLSCA